MSHIKSKVRLNFEHKANYNIMDKVILHVDLNNFYASVECIDHPEHLSLPFAVCGSVEDRHGIVLAKNQVAKKLGVKTGDTVHEAQKKCGGHLTVVPPHFEKYVYYSKKVREIYYTFTDQIETFGLDECWLDVTGSQKLFGCGKEIADKIRERVKKELNLTVSVGVSFSKVFAKLGSDMKKPDATTVISRDNYKNVVWPLPAEELLFIGKHTIEKLHLLNIFTIGDLANAKTDILKDKFGIVGIRMQKDARGIEDGKVLKFNEKTPMKSVGSGITARHDLVFDDDVSTVMEFLSDDVATRLRSYGLTATGVAVCIRSNDLKSFSRQKKLLYPTNSQDSIAKECFELFKENYDLTKDLPIRTLTITAINLVSENDFFQSSFLYDDKIDEEKMLGKAVDKIRSKFGKSAIGKASLLNSESLFRTTNPKIGDMLPFQRGNREKNNSSYAQ